MDTTPRYQDSAAQARAFLARSDAWIAAGRPVVHPYVDEVR